VKLALELKSDRVAPGEPVAGRVIVLEGGPSRSLALALTFHERSQYYEAIPYSAGYVLHEGDLASGQTLDFHFRMPATAPPTVKCKHSELYWQLLITSDQPGFDAHARHRVEVVAG
jgi:hypothetical protein